MKKPKTRYELPPTIVGTTVATTSYKSSSVIITEYAAQSFPAAVY
ncbi:MAG TPA: hypothetical protein PLS16_08230 [Chitinophagales bacterium]|nr:hypothetical protein [Chitinophagales bacterium]